MTDDTPCQQCRTDIPTDARTCPQCGYDPAPGRIALLGYLVCLPLTAIGVFMVALSALAVAVGGVTVVEALGAVLATGVVFGLPALYVRWYRRRRRATAGEGSA